MAVQLCINAKWEFLCQAITPKSAYRNFYCEMKLYEISICETRGHIQCIHISALTKAFMSSYYKRVTRACYKTRFNLMVTVLFDVRRQCNTNVDQCTSHFKNEINISKFSRKKKTRIRTKSNSMSAHFKQQQGS